MSWQGSVNNSGPELVLHSDGASRGNPGEAGAGAVLYDKEGGEVRALTRYLGKVTNNVAEYQGLILGIKAALELRAASLSIRLDSELLVKQLNGQYRVKSPLLKPLFDEVKTLLQGVGQVDIIHVRREFNKRADELANQAIDQR
jgi:ribonuclease HI